MTTTQFLIVLLIFNIPHSFCQHSLEAEESFVELGLFQRILYEYNEQLGGSHSCWHMIVDSPHSVYGVQPIFPNNACHKSEINYCAWAGHTTTCRSVEPRSNEVRKHAMGIHLSTLLGMGRLALKYTLWSCIKQTNIIAFAIVTAFELTGAFTWAKYKVESMRTYNVLYLQPAEGKLGANLQITEFSWIPLPLYVPEIRSVNSNSANFFLDDLILDSGYALTRIQLIYMTALKPNMVRGFGIRASGRPYSHSGDLVLELGNALTIEPNASTERYTASEFPAVMDKVGMSLSKLSPENREYVKLELSDIRDDYEQRTVPLFHNPRVADHHKPLSGFGIFLETLKSNKRLISLRFHSLQ